ncbi:hypothetical protein NE237_002971 [Protea cynaroides]|uniref:Uncharacterized protein n=1 Tax=Protea cynaroides TaxID=273540 RepID=A0A9Q0KG27_9MAGN|nr:hypothetical protein NE237_002971 [Protea cynaroides]
MTKLIICIDPKCIRMALPAFSGGVYFSDLVLESRFEVRFHFLQHDSVDFSRGIRQPSSIVLGAKERVERTLTPPSCSVYGNQVCSNFTGVYRCRYGAICDKTGNCKCKSKQD